MSKLQLTCDSMSNTWMVMLTRLPGSTVTCQIHSRNMSYGSGKLGLDSCPVGRVNRPPHPTTVISIHQVTVAGVRPAINRNNSSQPIGRRWIECNNFCSCHLELSIPFPLNLPWVMIDCFQNNQSIMTDGRCVFWWTEDSPVQCSSSPACSENC